MRCADYACSVAWPAPDPNGGRKPALTGLRRVESILPPRVAPTVAVAARGR
jgi:hypothetical protein